jgi:5-methyltetrahydropteroyltriglutamate--homocysteine methyltransferase
MQLPPLAATTVGSFPRPNWLAKVERSVATFRLEGESLREGQDDATIIAIHDQEEAGLDLLTDGEQRRINFIAHVIGCWDGVDFTELHLKRQYRRRAQDRMLPRIMGKVKRRTPAAVEDVRFAKSHASRPVKMAVPGPMTVIDSTVNEAYDDEGALAQDIAAALNAELLDLQAAGCDVLQIDEPAMTRYHEKVAAYGAQALDRCLEGVTVPTIVHLCYGYPGGQGLQHEFEYPELLKLLLKTRIGGFAVEFGRSNYDPAVLAVCKDRLVMFGCVDPGDAPVPPVGAVVGRVRGALKYLDAAKVWLAPDCGLMTTSRENARAKARLLAEVAQEIRRSL